MNDKNYAALMLDIRKWNKPVPPTKQALCRANPNCETCVICHTTGRIFCKNTPLGLFDFRTGQGPVDDIRAFLQAIADGDEEGGREWLKEWQERLLEV